MYELTVALKYLIPRWRQLSVSIISLISVIVISLVVWLIVVFFSVTHGLERSWIEKMISFSAPVRITPTEAYYQSFYYKSDTISQDAGYMHRSIGEKYIANEPLAYQPNFDEEAPEEWEPPLQNESGEIVDIVKEAFAAAVSVPGVKAHDYEMTVAGLTILSSKDGQETLINQMSYLGSYNPDDLAIEETAIESVSSLADPVFLPKTFAKAGVQVGDQGYVSYQTATASSLQEMRSPVYVAGFFDPGIISLGGKFILADKELTSVIRAAYDTEDQTLSANGIHVKFADFKQAHNVKAAIVKELKKRGVSEYWKVESYDEYDFAKDLVQQLKSEKFLFSILSTIIIIVACSNIISMLVILVNDKRQEIGILRAMGASSTSIAAIFGLCGVTLGFIGSGIGIGIALLTLKNLDSVVGFVSSLQGHEMFNPLFYGETLPNTVSFNALLFVLVATAVISLLAGIIPAVKASAVRPASILRSE